MLSIKWGKNVKEITELSWLRFNVWSDVNCHKRTFLLKQVMLISFDSRETVYLVTFSNTE